MQSTGQTFTGTNAVDSINKSSDSSSWSLYGYSGNDSLTGSAFNDVLWGALGNDTLSGLGGNDQFGRLFQGRTKAQVIGQAIGFGNGKGREAMVVHGSTML